LFTVLVVVVLEQTTMPQAQFSIVLCLQIVTASTSLVPEPEVPLLPSVFTRLARLLWAAAAVAVTTLLVPLGETVPVTVAVIGRLEPV
jgi:predicted ATPase